MPPGQPLWTRLAFVALAAALLLVAAFAARAPVAQGAWSFETEYRGQAGAEPVEHPLRIVVPSSKGGEGLALRASAASVALRPDVPFDAGRVRVAIVDPAGQVRGEAVLDPTNPLSVPGGPPTTYLLSGDYALRVSGGEGNRTVTYGIVAAVFFPFAAAVEGWAVQPLALIAPAVVALAWAALPLPRAVAQRLGRWAGGGGGGQAPPP